VSSSGSAVAAPWQPSPGEPSIWLSAITIPSEGANLASAVINPTDADVRFGVSGIFDRWTGTAWTSSGIWTTSLDFWGGFGSISPPQTNVAIRAIGLTAPPHRAGPIEYFAVPPLSPGWYRVGHDKVHDGAPVYGVFRIATDAQPPVPIDNPSGALLMARPSFVEPAGGEVGIVGFPALTGTQTSEGVHRFNQGLSSTCALQRWDGSEWVAVTTLVVRPATPPLDNEDQVAVAIPALESGAYRIVRHSDDAGDLARVIWVRDAIS
jgi:hypothetical protein